jgi:hypothetical protein
LAFVFLVGPSVERSDKYVTVMIKRLMGLKAHLLMSDKYMLVMMKRLMGLKAHL